MYRQDLAHIHHEGFGDFARLAAPGILQLFRSARIPRGLVVDLGCGSGIWARALLHAGYEVQGVDVSSHMLKLARRQAPAAHLLLESLDRVALPPCVAVTALGEVLSYHLRVGEGRARLKTLFRRVAQALPTGGLFVFDLLMDNRELRRAYRTWKQANDWAVLVEVAEPRRGWLTREITTFHRTSNGFRRRAEHHWLRLYQAPEILKTLADAGFATRVTRRYGTLPLAPGRQAFVARKCVTPTTMNEIPKDFSAILKRKSLDEFFSHCTGPHRREYLKWIDEAKRPETRKKRIDQAVKMLAHKQNQAAARSTCRL